LPVLQLVADTLVAVVDTLLTLALLYLVNALVEVPALELVVLIELRQLPDVIELELDAKGRPLRELFGDTPRFERPPAVSCTQRSMLGFGDMPW